MNIEQFLNNPIPVTVTDGASPNTTMVFAEVNVTTTSTQLAAANVKRANILVRNRGNVSVFLGFGATATTAGFEMEPDTDLTFGGGQQITAITASGTSEVHVLSEVVA